MGWRRKRPVRIRPKRGCVVVRFCEEEKKGLVGFEVESGDMIDGWIERSEERRGEESKERERVAAGR